MAELKKITMPSLKKAIKSEALNPDKIASVLMRAKVEFHVFHFDTKKYSKHKALEKLYSEITDQADTIIESLLGRLNLRLDVLDLEPLTAYTDRQVDICVDELHQFSEKLFEYGNSNNYQDIANLAAELQQLCNQTKYRLTLA